MQTFRIRYKSVLYWILYICLFQSLVSDYVGFRQINYICDMLLLAISFVVICRNSINVPKFQQHSEYFPLLMFAIIVFGGWVLNSVSFLSALWGIRNYGRFFLFYILIINIWDIDDISKCENIFLKLFPFHISVIAYQYFIEGLKQDRLSGLFGKAAGGNGGLMIYLSIVLCIIICQYEYKKISMRKFGVWTLLIFLNAALSELKFLFILAGILVAWYLLVVIRKGRGVIVALFFILSLYIGVEVLYYVFPDFANYLSIDNILEVLSDQDVYASPTDIGRTAVFSKLTPIITDWAGKDALFFGIGLGNGDYSDAIQILNSDFFTVYKDTHYTWLSLGYLFVETGYLGTIAYICFIIVLEVKAILSYQKNHSYYNLLGTFVPLACVALVAYNSSLRSNFAYMAFVALTWQTKANEYFRYVKL